MISRKLAIELKMNSFPARAFSIGRYFYPGEGDGWTQEAIDRGILIDADVLSRYFKEIERGYYVPTIEEAIEELMTPDLSFNGLIQKGPKVWIATGGTHRGFYGDDFLVQGEFPLEALLNLWLIQKRKA